MAQARGHTDAAAGSGTIVGMKVGRNDACPCGSGRKYKQCCLQASAPPDDLLWHRLRQVLDRQAQDILRFVRDQFGQGLIDEAWHEFMLFEGGPFDPKTVHLSVFLPWFFYDWEPDPMNTSVAPDRVPGFPARGPSFAPVRASTRCWCATRRAAFSRLSASLTWCPVHRGRASRCVTSSSVRRTTSPSAQRRRAARGRA
ncbi:MAG TPA: SEC-C metal-binding domain-containing protein, partial [Solirubrobacteraceae bacterium]